MVRLEEGCLIGLLLCIFGLFTETFPKFPINSSFISSDFRSTYTVADAVSTDVSNVEARGTWVSSSTFLYMFHNVSHSTAVPSGGGYKDDRRVNGNIRDSSLSPEKADSPFWHGGKHHRLYEAFFVLKGEQRLLATRSYFQQ